MCVNKLLRNNISGSYIMKIMKNLIAFDFDHTIIEKNSDIVIMDLIPRENIPDSLRTLYREDGWTNFMQGIFKLLYSRGIKEKEIKAVIENLKPIDGMCPLIKYLSEKMNYDIIIISDSNSYFINVWLEKMSLVDNVLKVYTNPAKFDNDGLLNISMYHLQDSCQMSTKNLCKGQILDDFIKMQRSGNNITYGRVVYVGDGTNDFCPILRLGTNDLACARAEFKLCDLLQKSLAGKSLDNFNKTGEMYTIKAKFLAWKNGDDILGELQSWHENTLVQ